MAPAAAAGAGGLPRSGDYIADARTLVREFVTSVAAISEALQLKPGSYGDGRDPSVLAGVLPGEPFARETWKAVRTCASRMIGTQRATTEQGQALRLRFEHVLAHDAASAGTPAAHAASAGLRERFGVGAQALYAMDFTVALLLKSALTEVPVSTPDTVLTPTFARSRVLVFLASRFPLFLRRYLGAVYLCVPALVPCARFLAIPGPPGTPPSVPDTDAAAAAAPTFFSGGRTFLETIAPRVIALHAAFMGEDTGRPQRGANRNPFALREAWALMVRLLNAPPFAGAELVLQGVLLYCGHDMHRSYGRQASRLLCTLAEKYLPAMQSVVGHDEAAVQVCKSLLLRRGSGGFDERHVPVFKEPPSGQDLPLDADED